LSLYSAELKPNTLCQTILWTECNLKKMIKYEQKWK
jgi:hypothetical protein